MHVRAKKGAPTGCANHTHGERNLSARTNLGKWFRGGGLRRFDQGRRI